MKIYNVERKEAYDPDTEPSEIDVDSLLLGYLFTLWLWR